MSVTKSTPVDPNPFLYAVGLTDWRLPEPLLIVPGVPELMATARARPRLDEATMATTIAGYHSILLTKFATLQRRRQRPFQDGEHVHAHEISTNNCVNLIAAAPSDEFPLGDAIQLYGRDGYRVLRGPLYDHFGRTQDGQFSSFPSPRLQ